LDIFSDNDSIYKKLNPFSYNDDIAELEEQLKKELWRIIEDNLTERQKEVVKLYASGKTQIEIAKTLGVNQSSITKCINGNVDYKNKDTKGKPITYGGVRLKLQKIVKEDQKVNEILQKIADLRDSDPF
jgi:transcriptional regulator